LLIDYQIKGVLIMLKNKLTIAIASALIALGAVGCGGSDDNDSPDSSASVKTGVFLDSAVGGINYATETQSGTTNAKGEFSYKTGEDVTFSIGGIKLPKGPAMSIVTPLSLAGAENSSDTTALNIARMLQTLDSDNNPSNGITISAAAHTAGELVTIDFTSDTLATQIANVIGELGFTLVDEQTAQDHMDETLNSNGVLTKSFVNCKAFTFSGKVLSLNNSNGGNIDFGQDNGEPDINSVSWTVNSTGQLLFTESGTLNDTDIEEGVVASKYKWVITATNINTTDKVISASFSVNQTVGGNESASGAATINYTTSDLCQP
jgi:hypothetical protein